VGDSDIFDSVLKGVPWNFIYTMKSTAENSAGTGKAQHGERLPLPQLTT
jgi:hypothetical protein